MGERDTYLVMIGVALVGAGLLYALRQRGPVRGTPSAQADVWALCDRVARPFRSWRAIVIHHSATPTGNAAVFDRAHRRDRGWRSLGYHFVIGNGRGAGDGEIEVGPRWRGQEPGAHAAGMNDIAIGVCLVGDFTKQRPTAPQMASLHRLVTHLQSRYEIPANAVLAHRETSGASTLCPGENFPMASFRAKLAH